MKQINVLSFGAGVQSTTLLLMSCLGVLPKPDFIIFADTGWEPKAVYEHLDWCKSIAEKHGMKIDFVSNGNIREDILNGKKYGKRFASLPFFTKGIYPIFKNEEDLDINQLTLFDSEIILDKEVIGYEERKGMVRRQCTNEYKIMPIKKACRSYAGLKYKQRAKDIQINLWMGISTDEIQRVRTSQEPYIVNKYPLIDLNMSRIDCLSWIEKKGFPAPPKSSCIGCPFHNDAMWLDMKLNDNNSWNDAVLIDREIRLLPRLSGQAFLHRSCKPLDEVDFGENQMDINDFINECTGSCGV